MKRAYADLINNILQHYYYDAENYSKANTWELGMALAALRYTANYAGDSDEELVIAAMIEDCKKGVIPKPAYVDGSNAKVNFI